MVPITPALGSRWRTKACAENDLKLGRSVRYGNRFITLDSLLSDDLFFVEAKIGEHSLGMIDLKSLEKPASLPLRHVSRAPRPVTKIPTETEARAACERAKTLRRRIERAGVAMARMATHVEHLRRELNENEDILAHWETSVTPINRIVASNINTPKTTRPKVNKLRAMENKLRAALGLPPLADDEAGLV